MKLLTSNYDPSTIYTGRISVYLGEYDFEKKRFPIVEYGKSTPLSLLNLVLSTKQPTGGGHTITNTKPFPHRFRAFLDQSLPHLPVVEVPVTPNDAEKYVKARNQKAGYRKVKAIVKFKIIGTHTEGSSSEYSALITDVFYKL